MLQTIAGRLGIVTILAASVVSHAQADVTVSLRRGRLTVTGDSAANNVNIDVERGMVYVTCGETAESYPEAEVSSIRVTTRQGDDRVVFGAVDVPSTAASLIAGSMDISVTTAGGEDSVTVSGQWGDVSITSGGGDDLVCLTNATISGTTRIRTGGGNDQVTVGVDLGSEDPDVTFGDDVNIGLGGGDDSIFAGAGMYGNNSVKINGNAGEDCFFYSNNDIDLETVSTSLEDCFDDEG